jgi:hypothetical protein
MFRFLRRREEMLTHLLKMVRPPAVGPARRHAAYAQVIIDAPDNRCGDHTGDRVDDQHRQQAGQGADQTDALVIQGKARTERGTARTRLIIGRVVEQTVGHQEEHRDDDGDGVQIADGDDGKSHHGGQHEAAARIGRWADAARERLQQGKDAVAGKGLQDARRAHEGCQG